MALTDPAQLNRTLVASYGAGWANLLAPELSKQFAIYAGYLTPI